MGGLIDTDELVALIVGGHDRLTASSAEVVRQAAEDVRSRGVVADSESEASHWFRELIATSPELLTQEAQDAFAGVEIFAVDSYHPNALARRAGAGAQIIIFDGLRHLVHFFTDYVTILSHLMTIRPAAVIDDGEGGTHPEALLFSMACFSILADFFRTNRPPTLLHDLLGEGARRNVEIGYKAALLFVLLHELGHIELGHLGDGPISELAQVSLVEPEDLNLLQEQEFEADRFALAHFSARYRAEMISSLMFLLGSHALLEAFHRGQGATHPLAINRLAALADASGLSEQDRAIVSGWIADRVLAFRRMASDRERTSHGSIMENIAASMPVDHAYAILAEVRRRVEAEHGVLSLE